MRRLGSSVRSQRPEQLTRQAASGARLQKQGSGQGPQPRPGSPASAPSHRPRPRASARRAGAPGGIVSAARAWPRLPEAPCAGSRSSGGARRPHCAARDRMPRRPWPVCAATAAQRSGAGRTSGPWPPARASALHCRPRAGSSSYPTPGAARGGASSGSAPALPSRPWAGLDGGLYRLRPLRCRCCSRRGLKEGHPPRLRPILKGRWWAGLYGKGGGLQRLRLQLCRACCRPD